MRAPALAFTERGRVLSESSRMGDLHLAYRLAQLRLWAGERRV